MKIVTVAIFGKIFAFHPVMLHQSPLLLSVQTYYQTIPLILSKVINLHFWLGATQNKFQEIEFSFFYPLQPSRPDNKDNHKIFMVTTSTRIIYLNNRGTLPLLLCKAFSLVNYLFALQLVKVIIKL